LLLISIGFGVTYSYFNGRSNELSNVGNVTMATLKVEIDGVDETTGQTTPFSLHNSSTHVVPGQPLSNTALQISNSSPVDTYMAVVYYLSIVEPGPWTEDTNPNELEAMDIQEASVGDGWRKVIQTAEDGKTKINMLIYMGAEGGKEDGIFDSDLNDNTSLILDSGSLKVPESWGNELQGATVTLTFVAYVIQADAISNKYPNITTTNTPDVVDRTQEIANMFIKEFSLDNTTATPEPPAVEPEEPVGPTE